MNPEYRLETPEAVTLAYEPAGIGSRSLAAMLDYLVVAGMSIVIAIGSILLATFGEVGTRVATILGLSLAFVLFWGYFLLFETLWSGQTPGKKAMHIRVLKTTGYPISVVDSTIRNIVRIVDFLPSLYGIGIVSMFISRQSRRLGDYAAGTLVVKERVALHAADLVQVSTSLGLPGNPLLGESDPGELAWNLYALTADDVAIMRRYLQRAPQLRGEIQTRVGSQIAQRVADRLGARSPADPRRFVERVLYLLDSDERL